MTRKSYLAIQTSILLGPALLATVCLQVNPYITNPVEEFAGYAYGLTGLLLMLLLHVVLGIGKVASSVIFLAMFTVPAIFVFYWSYRKESRRNTILIGLNSCLSIWSVALGLYWMFISMQ